MTQTAQFLGKHAAGELDARPTVPGGRRHASRAPQPDTGEPEQMSHRAVLEALSGLLLALFGAVFAVATVSGALSGGLLVDSSFGWRGCFFVGLPIAALAFVVLQRTLHVRTIKREVSIDSRGATLITGGVSVLLIWVSLAGN